MNGGRDDHPAGSRRFSPHVAELLAQAAHGTGRTKSGGLFIDHVRRVAARMQADADPDAVVAALLHDTVEKGSFEWDDLRAAGVGERLLAIVDALTERPGEPEEQYLARCAAHPLALRIKRADIEDKLDERHTSGLTPAGRDRIEARARRRLALLNHLAAHRAPDGPPSRG